MPHPVYDPLPRSSPSLDLPRPHGLSSDEFKDKRRPSRRGALLGRKARRCRARLCRPQWLVLGALIFLHWQFFCNASYLLASAPPYQDHPTETVFIAANIVDGELVRGAWGRSLLALVARIGRERVFVSIYGAPTEALRQLEAMLECESRIVSEEEEPLHLAAIPRTRLPTTGERRAKRIAYLAAVRNKVLEPLYAPGPGRRRWDKVLFINDVFFEPEGATRLLWGTNGGAAGERAYEAACAADFVSSWKYYDTFATRDVEGYSIGVPLFPWFAAEGSAVSRNDVLAGKDAVRVRSCWGGMVSFRGHYFWARDVPGVEEEEEEEVEEEDAPSGPGKPLLPASTASHGIGAPSLPLRFRSEPEPFWDSSECCLIHADILSLAAPPAASSAAASRDRVDRWDTGIYMNPYVRTSYSARTHRHLEFTKRWERLFSPVQRVLNRLARMPRYNYRRAETEGDVLVDKLWISVRSNITEAQAVYAAEHGFPDAAADDEGRGRGEGGRALVSRATLGEVRGKEFWAGEGYYVEYRRTARRGGFCGVRQLLVVKEGELLPGEGNWDNLLDRVPPVDCCG